MSKYNLTNILNEYIGGSRHGTINISYRDLQDAMDQVEDNGDFIVREKHGQSGDGKVNREFEVVFIGGVKGDNKQEELGFTVYDYKFGFDPGSEDNFDEVLPFSVGGSNKEAALKIAKFLLGNRVQGYMANDKEILRNFDPKDLNDVLFKGEVVNEENVVKDLAKADEVIKMIKMMNPDVRADLLMRIARMGQKKINEGDLVYLSDGDLNFIKSIVARMEYDKDPIDADEFSRLKQILQSTIREMDENRREKNPVGMGQLYVQPAVQREVKFHLDAYDKGDIDVDDMIQAIEDIIFGYVKAPGQRMEESTGPSDKAETEDDVVNIDKVAGPGAKGRNYGAETSANTAEDDMEDKEVANPRPMFEAPGSTINISQADMDKLHNDGKADIDGHKVVYKMNENGDVDDFANELSEDDVNEQMYIDHDDFMDEIYDARAKEIAPILKGVDMDIIVDFVRTHNEDIRGASDEEIRDEFENFRSVNYDYIDEDLKEQFKRFM